MTFVGLAMCVSLIAFGAVSAVGSLVTVLAWLSLPHCRTPTRRARVLLAIRLLPTVAALTCVTVLFVPAFLLLEPRDTNEVVTAPMLALALAAAAGLGIGPVRALGASLATRRLEREWRRSARVAALPGLAIPGFVIEETFPVVTVVGMLRPRLYIARQVLETCSPSELAAVVSHEMAHVLSGDNWKRLLLRSLPDWIGITPWGTRIEREWSEAREEAADDRAASEASSLDLAAALLKVARLGSSTDPRMVPASALYRGEGIARRVQRLLQRSSSAADRERGTPLLSIGLVLLGASLLAGVGLGGLLQRVHALTEVVVRSLQ